MKGEESVTEEIALDDQTEDGSNEAGTELGIEATTVEAEKPVVIETEPASKSEPETEAELETIPIIPETTSNSYTQLQKGSKGEQVVELQRRLTELGYDPSGIDGDYGDGTTAAVIIRPVPETTPQRDSIVRNTDPVPTQTHVGYVWITQSSKRYHLDERCSNMENPILVSVEEAIAMGKTECLRCYR